MAAKYLKYRRLTRDFFFRPTLAVARELLGKILIRRQGRQTKIVRISEVESYIGQGDKACHASRGRTPRCEVMFGQPGIAYVYMIYGMYHCLNIVTEKTGFPAAVLIRGGQILDPEDGYKTISVLDGPGKLCRELNISRQENGEDLTISRQLFLAEDGWKPKRDQIRTTPRIGIDYAGEDAKKPWRYIIKPNS
jgi:DNA-3-methyladenine glycosylase